MYVIMMSAAMSINAASYIFDIKESVKSCAKMYKICEDEEKKEVETATEELSHFGDIEFKNVVFG